MEVQLHTTRNRGNTSLTQVADWLLTRCVHDGPLSCVFDGRPAGDKTTPTGIAYCIKIPVQSGPRVQLAIEAVSREYEILGRLDHPHIVPLLDGRRGQSPYLVMPHLGPMTLADWVAADHRLSIATALWFTRQVTSALAYLHDLGWSHLDVKPANVVVASDGRATLIDFANACPTGEPWPGHPYGGTVAYLAPERILDASRNEPATDIFSVGCVLFELLGGCNPFPIDTPLPDRLVKPPADIRDVRTSIPPRISRLVTRLLSRLPERRPTAQELHDELMDLEIEFLDRVA